METDHAVEFDAADAAEKVSKLLPAAAVPADRVNARRERIAELELGHGKVNTIGPVLDGVKADLSDFALDIGVVIKQLFKDHAGNADVVEIVEPVLDNYLRVTHQLERLLKAEARLSAPAKDTGDSEFLVQLLQLKGSLSDGTSKEADGVLITGGAEPTEEAMEVGR